MAEIIKIYKQNIPALKFIGIKYNDKDRVDGGFEIKWKEWFKNGWFDVIKKHTDKLTKMVYEDGDAYISLMRCKENEPFEYWIGIFMPENTVVPETFDFVDFPAGHLGVCWVYGKENEVHFKENQCTGKLSKNGFDIIPDLQNAWWYFERYGSTRFSTPDAEGNIILDVCYFVK